jgi:hypothetical protein
MMSTSRFFLRFFSAAVAVPLLLGPAPRAGQQQQKPNKKEKRVKKDALNFDGGILFATEGSLSELTCFQLMGRATAPVFFDDFKRIDDENGTEYRSSQKVVTEFPEELSVSFTMFDIPCKRQTLQPGPRQYLTQEMMKSLRFSFYWKRGIELRHIENLKREAATAEPIEPFNTESTEELPIHYRWFLEFTIPSAGVPLADRLVLIIRNPDGSRAARVAARL